MTRWRGVREQLASVDDAIAGVEQRAANVWAGYVYVISNIGAFGPDVVKIGMTRRLDLMDRVRELGDASVPFRFDTHALFFSEDAVALETALHQRLSRKRVNLVNPRREFFYATPAQVRISCSGWATTTSWSTTTPPRLSSGEPPILVDAVLPARRNRTCSRTSRPCCRPS